MLPRPAAPGLAAVMLLLSAPLCAQSGPPAPPAAPAPAPAPGTGMVGVPTIELGAGFTVKPRGRIHLDHGHLSGPGGSASRTDGPALLMRRLRFGVEGDLPGAFSYRVEADFEDDVVELIDAWVRYRTGPVTITAGQQNIAQGLEELTSSNDYSFLERAAFTDAFGFARRLGVQVEYSRGDILLQAGVGSENLLAINDGVPNTVAANARAVWSPRLGATQLHFGAHANVRDYATGGRAIRYRQRAFLRNVETRFLATPAMLAAHDRGWGLEAAVLSGRWHAQAEAHWNHVDRIGSLADPTFFGLALETGLFLTHDQRTYRGGVFRAPTVRRPVTAGGPGAVQVNARYDRLDLNDAAIVGGVQDSAQLSLVWWPVPQVRLMLTYARLDYRDAAIAIAGRRDYGLDAVGTRLQIAF